MRLSFARAQADAFVGILHDIAETVGTRHSRIETRQAWMMDDPAVLAWLQERHAWPGLHAVGMVRGERRIGSERTVEDHSSLLARLHSAHAFGDAVRSHWGIENSVHSVLDGAFHEDQSRIRAGYAAENVAVLHHIALNLLRHQTVKRKSMKGRRLKAAWETDFLLRVLTRG